ncbi:hypothetical protein [Stigmatella aurantiaca]|uniref:hypothetical protein n=1 Tax=Stigmatella aurantiaca TaxID=41 RepID=UPI000565392B|nr:hypothetical protein [Stigmatella aurantiaca]
MALFAEHVANIQGLILRGYTHPYSCHLLFSFDVPAKAPGFLKALYPSVTSAEAWGTAKPQVLLNIGLTFTGIQSLGVLAPSDLENFPQDFAQNPAEEIGDVGPSAPANWWYGRFSSSDVHCIVHVYALSAEALTQKVGEVTSSASQWGVRERLPLKSGSGRIEGYLREDGTVHFGYKDGISNPSLDDDEQSQAPEALNSFLIGYSASSASQPAPTEGKALEFAKDGSYMAFRIMHQDAAAFEGFLTQQARTRVSKAGALLGRDPGVDRRQDDGPLEKRLAAGAFSRTP